MAFKISGTTVIDNNADLQSITQGLEFMEITGAARTFNLNYGTWTTVGSYEPGDGGYWSHFMTIHWSRTGSGNNYSYYFGCTDMMSHTGGLANTLARYQYIDRSTDYAPMMGGGSYGEQVYWRQRHAGGPGQTPSADAGIEVYWYGTKGLNNGAVDPMSVTYRIYRVLDG